MDHQSGPGVSEHKPSPSGIHCQKGPNPCVACQSLSALDAEYAAARMVLLSRVNEHHDPFILRLPVELASRIFTHCLPYPASLNVFSTLEDEADEEYTQPIPFILASVSAQWRRIALATPQLWNILSLNFEGEDPAPSPFIINEWLHHSGTLPLYIRVFCGEEPESEESLIPLFNHLNRESHRWKVLELHLPSRLFSQFHGSSSTSHPTNSLVRLKLYPVAEEYNVMDYLPVSFRLQTQPFPRSLIISKISLSMISVGWTRLTNFDATSVTLGDCMRVMLYSPRLERCTLEEVERDHDDSELPCLHVTHHNLSYLDVFHHMPDFLTFFTLPSLRELHFDASNTPSTQIEEFLERSRIFGTLDAITLSGYEPNSSIDYSDLYELLRALSSLTRLSIVETLITDDFFQLFAPSTSQVPLDIADGVFLPRLRYLRIKVYPQFYHTLPRKAMPDRI
ncbi:hypothetical protein CPB83DRAFT_833981 [Crepidotus variabilis]|uniref:F-box domain-containing protein n=1 Tax=Crepidotus variabilis TaxID=179855 RepID=A0A9P6EKU2_9AGAR|nr:hypothetical protein CPB83DRAFT_833981 [Crepidotus variabilis]